MAGDPTKRFSDRVANYVKYRPSYPAQLFDALVQLSGFPERRQVADIGSGTGIFAAKLLDRGWHVCGIEPNDAMREAAEQQLATFPHFKSVAATAEQTTLLDNSVEMVTAAQAFHWFDAATSRTEFSRILRPGGHVGLVWNERKHDSPFLKQYEAGLVRYATDYNEVRHENIGEAAIAEFFADFRVLTFHNSQTFNLQGLIGRLESSSYTPTPDHPDYAPLVAAVTAAYEQNAIDGQISFDYRTHLYFGTVRK